jgi:hypothetical protein
MSENDNVVPFDRKSDDTDALSSSERETIMQTLSNVMDFQEKLECGMKMASAVIAELQSHVRDLEHEMAALKKALPKKPAILNALGARAN